MMRNLPQEQDLTLYGAPGLHPVVTGDFCPFPCLIAKQAVAYRKC